MENQINKPLSVVSPREDFWKTVCSPSEAANYALDIAMDTLIDDGHYGARVYALTKDNPSIISPLLFDKDSALYFVKEKLKDPNTEGIIWVSETWARMRNNTVLNASIPFGFNRRSAKYKILQAVCLWHDGRGCKQVIKVLKDSHDRVARILQVDEESHWDSSEDLSADFFE